MSYDMWTDPLCSERRRFGYGSQGEALDQGMNAEAVDGVSIAIEKHALLRLTPVSDLMQLRHHRGPQRASAL
jgi:hypothetical protein